MNKLPQIIKRKIGAVDILDFRGEFVGPWALRGRDEIGHFLKTQKSKNLLINLKGLETVDSLGVKAITENISGVMRTGVVVGNLSVMEMFSRVAGEKDFKYFRNEEEIIKFFGEELVQWEEKSYPEKRKHQRLRTAIPLEFSYEDEKGESVCFHSVVTDLSEGGLYAEYLDLDEVSFGRLKLNPYEFRVLNLKIKLPGVSEIHAKGKVARAVMEGEQVGLGIEFHAISEGDRDRIANFLKI